MSLFIGVACAVLFFRAATYERMSPWLWVLASVGLTVLVSLLSSSMFLLLGAQVALFLAMWWYNAQRTGDGSG